MDISEAARIEIERQLRELKDIQKQKYGVVSVSWQSPKADLRRTKDGKAEWGTYGGNYWLVGILGSDRFSKIGLPESEIKDIEGFKFLFSAHEKVTSLDFDNNSFIVNGEHVGKVDTE